MTIFKISETGTVEVASREDSQHVVSRLAARSRLRQQKRRRAAKKKAQKPKAPVTPTEQTAA